MKLIKINEDHYIIVDDSKIKEGDTWYNASTGLWWKVTADNVAMYNQPSNMDRNGLNKITHSTQPLEYFFTDPKNSSKVFRFDKVKYISLQEVKELIGEVDVEKDYVLSRLCVHNKRNPDYIPYDEDDELIKPTDCSCDNCFYGRTILSEKILQLNQALEDNKEKKYTYYDIENAFNSGRGYGVPDNIKDFNSFIQSLQPKTEWEVEIVDGKLKLL